MILDCPTIRSGHEIPDVHTRDGANTSPLLKWDLVPDGVATFVMICEDPDAPDGTFAHWVVYDIPVDMRRLDQGLPRDGQLANGAKQGRNDFGNLGYDGPSPPPGDKAHTYHFTVYALDRKVGLEPGATRTQVFAAMDGHILDQADVSGLRAGPVPA